MGNVGWTGTSICWTRFRWKRVNIKNLFTSLKYTSNLFWVVLGLWHHKNKLQTFGHLCPPTIWSKKVLYTPQYSIFFFFVCYRYIFFNINISKKSRYIEAAKYFFCLLANLHFSSDSQKFLAKLAHPSLFLRIFSLFWNCQNTQFNCDFIF